MMAKYPQFPCSFGRTILLHSVLRRVPSAIVPKLPTKVTCCWVHPWLVFFLVLAHFPSSSACFLGPSFKWTTCTHIFVSGSVFLGTHTKTTVQTWGDLRSHLISSWPLGTSSLFAKLCEKVPASSVATQYNSILIVTPLYFILNPQSLLLEFKTTLSSYDFFSFFLEIENSWPSTSVWEPLIYLSVGVNLYFSMLNNPGSSKECQSCFPGCMLSPPATHHRQACRV